MPSITFGILPSEIFPWAILMSLFFIRKLVLEYFLLIVIFLPTLILGFNHVDNLMDILRSSFSFINAIILFFVFIKIQNNVIYKMVYVIRNVLLIQIITGIITFVFNISIIENFIQLLVPSSWTSGGITRGVSGFSTEPARQALEIILMYSAYIAFQKLKNPNYNRLKYDFSLLFYLIFINKSITGIGIFLVYLIVINLSFKGLIKFSIIPIIFFVSMKIIPQEIIERNRLLSFTQMIIESDIDKKNFIINQSGFRFSSISVVYTNPSLIGYGLGNWKNGMRKTFQENNYFNNNYEFNTERLIEGVRPMSFISGLILECGLYLFSALLLLIIVSIPKNYNKNLIGYKLGVKTIGFLLFSIFFIGAIGNPIAFICIGILINQISLDKMGSTLSSIILNRVQLIIND